MKVTVAPTVFALICLFSASAVGQDGYSERGLRILPDAEAGVPSLMGMLGMMHLRKSVRDAPYDLVQAHKWLSLAVKCWGDKDAAGLFASTLEDIRPQMSTEQIKTAHQLAANWKGTCYKR